MPLILAIEPDRRQANQLNAMVRGRLHAELVLAGTAEDALAALGDRVPDLILTSALLSPRDECALADRLRALDGAAAHVQTLTIPVLAPPRPRADRSRGMLAALLRAQPLVLDGCDPAVFAEQCAAYLERTATERAKRLDLDAVVGPVVDEPCAPVEAVAVPPGAMPPPEPELAAELGAAAARAFEPEIAPAFERELLPAFEIVEVDEEDAAVDEQTDDTIELDLSSLLDEGVIGGISIGAIDEVAEVPQGAEVAEVAAAAEVAALAEFAAELAEFAELADEDPVAHKEAAHAEEQAEPIDDEPEAEPWTAVPFSARQLWPLMEGVAIETSRPPLEAPRAAAPVAAEPIHQRSARSRNKPVQDEWGFFDPNQCGFAALLAKLDEITDGEDTPVERPA